MNFLSMKYFTTVARIRSFTKAAADLKITQQTLSAHIAGVEKELGCTLLVRHVPLELTYAGEVFLNYATTFQKNYERMLMELNDISENHSGLIKVGIGFTRGRAVMPKLIDAFQRKWSHYEIQLIEKTNEELTKLLKEGEIDLAIATFPEQEPDIEVRPFYHEEMVLAIPKKLVESLYPGKRDELAEKLEAGDLSMLGNCPFVMGKPEDISGGIARDFLHRNSLHPQVKARSDNIATLIALAIRGVGACFCQANFIRMTLSEDDLRELDLFRLPAEANYEIRFGIPKQAFQRKAVRAFMETALKVVSSDAAEQKPAR